MKKIIIGGCMACLVAVGAYAQSGTNSPYSQFGIGVLSDASQGFSRGMNGVGLGLRQGNIINAQNPASYSAVDSLTMIFDVGLMGQKTNFKEGNVSVNANNANVEYAVGSFRLLPRVGLAFGILPYSNVGYKYTTSKYLDATNGTIVETYNGSGGLRQAFLGLGWQVTSQLSVGANVGFLWGVMERTLQTSNTTYVNSLKKSYSVTVNNYKADLGVQWTQPINNSDVLTLGATVGIGHKLGADLSHTIINLSTADTTQTIIEDAISLPMTYAVGATWTHERKLIVGADFHLERWGALDFPDHSATGFGLQSGVLKDRYQVNAGLDYVPNATDMRHFLSRVHYRCGLGFATPYYNIDGKSGPKEFSVSAGFGIPLQNSYNHRSVLNISAQWAHTSADNLIRENTFRINVGLTFNERWFAKWKID